MHALVIMSEDRPPTHEPPTALHASVQFPPSAESCHWAPVLPHSRSAPGSGGGEYGTGGGGSRGGEVGDGEGGCGGDGDTPSQGQKR